MESKRNTLQSASATKRMRTLEVDDEYWVIESVRSYEFRRFNVRVSEAYCERVSEASCESVGVYGRFRSTQLSVRGMQ